MTAVVFDLGNVVVRWTPHVILSEAFITETDFFTWNTELDRGAPFDELVGEMRGRYPHFADQFDAFRDRWPETLGEVMQETLDVVDALRGRGVPCYVLTNSSAETLPRSALVQEVLTQFDGVAISGALGLLKPDAAIFHATAEMFGLDPSATWFVDDSRPNVEAARALGWNAIHFTGSESLDPLAGLEA